MRKYKIIIFVIIALLIGGIAFFIHETSYKKRIEKDFGFNVSNLKHEKISEKEEWAPNGDGEKIIILKYENFIDTKNLDRFPIKEDLPPNHIPKEFLSIPNGYYKCVIDKNDNRNFKIFIVDPDKKEICVYNQIF